MDINRTDKIIQYALLVAGEEDDLFYRELGPIHLIKYVYLADLAYAEEHEGETFTGARWKFFKFGPWAQEVNARIEPALTAIEANRKTFPSNYDDKDEWVRWIAIDNETLFKLERKLPLVITSCLRRHIHKFGKLTPELLAYVYSTKPMLSAAPGEFLDFSNLKRIEQNSLPTRSASSNIGKKKRKDLNKKMMELRALSTVKLAAKKKDHKDRLVKPPISPRYDDVYFKGIEWLDSLAGAELPQGEIDVIFSDSIWKSPARNRDEFSD